MRSRIFNQYETIFNQQEIMLNQNKLSFLTSRKKKGKDYFIFIFFLKEENNVLTIIVWLHII